MDYQGGKYGLGMLSKHPILAAKEIKLPTGNEPRVALACKIQLPDRREIMVVNLHFDWVEDDKFRFQQAKELAKYLDTLTLPYVLMGDFNDQPQSRTLDLLSRGTMAAVKPRQDRFTFPSMKPTIEIDFIFAAPREDWQLNFSQALLMRTIILLQLTIFYINIKMPSDILICRTVQSRERKSLNVIITVC